MQVLLTEIALIVIFGSIFALIAKRLKQPLLVGYILAGMLIGPYGLNYIAEQENILAISELGITFLLFLVGIELNINKIKEVGSTVILGGIMQVFITAAIVFILSFMFGMPLISSFYMGIAIAFSSTLIGIKYLSEKKELDTYHGRLVVGILILQDIIAILIVSILPTLSSFNMSEIFFSVINGIALIGLSYVISKYVLTRLFNFASKNGELLFLVSLAICFTFANIAQMMGFSLTIGSFLAGVMIASVPYSLDIISRVKSLTTFFNALFFVTLGMQIIPNTIPLMLPAIFAYFLFAMILKPIIVYLIIRSKGYERKTSFISGLALGQISEFSLIIVTQGILLNHLTGDILSLIITLTILSMAVSTYLLGTETQVFLRWQKLMDFLDSRLKIKKANFSTKNEELIHAEIIINSHEKLSSIITDAMKNRKALVVGNNSQGEKVHSIYGSLREHEILEKIDTEKVKLVISFSYDNLENKAIIQLLKKHSTAEIIVFSPSADEAVELYEIGADYVIIPEIEGDKKIASIITGFSKEDIHTVLDKIRNIEHLRRSSSSS